MPDWSPESPSIILDIPARVAIVGGNPDMKASANAFRVTLTAVLLAFLFGCASNSNSPNAAEIDLLHRSYAYLLVANHNYRGHRDTAMKEIAAACTLLGSDVKGDDGRGREGRTVSDTQLRQAQDMLEQARGMAAAKNQTEVADHINNAITQLGIALTVR